MSKRKEIYTSILNAFETKSRQEVISYLKENYNYDFGYSYIGLNMREESFFKSVRRDKERLCNYVNTITTNVMSKLHRKRRVTKNKDTVSFLNNFCTNGKLNETLEKLGFIKSSVGGYRINYNTFLEIMWQNYISKTIIKELGIHGIKLKKGATPQSYDVLDFTKARVEEPSDE